MRFIFLTIFIQDNQEECMHLLVLRNPCFAGAILSQQPKQLVGLLKFSLLNFRAEL